MENVHNWESVVFIVTFLQLFISWKCILSPLQINCLRIFNFFAVISCLFWLLVAAPSLWSYFQWGGMVVLMGVADFVLHKKLVELLKKEGVFKPRKKDIRRRCCFYSGTLTVNERKFKAYCLGGPYSMRIGKKYDTRGAELKNGRINITLILGESGDVI